MDFVWREVCEGDEATVLALFRSEGVRFANADYVVSFSGFCKCWQDEVVEEFFVKSAHLGGEMVAVIAYSRSADAVFTILEFIVVPGFREKWFGSKLLSEFISRSTLIVGEEITDAVAVIEWDNYRAQGVFLRAGFVNSGTHPDGDAIRFVYKK